MLAFEALGDNCEFGLVQRQAGAEPLGLLRFAGFFVPVEDRLQRLLRALDCGFEGLGRVETVRVEAAGAEGRREYLVHDSAFELLYHTFQAEGRIDPETLRALEAKKLGFLRRKFFNDLATGEKILVWKSNLSQAEDEIDQLAERLRRFGPNTLLWVAAADADHAAGTAEIGRAGLLKGYVERFAPYDDATDIAYDSWFAMCEKARRLQTAPAHATRVQALNSASGMPDDVCPDLTGESYLDLLQRFHSVLRPKTYLEIGSREGASLALADCDSIAVDPEFSLRPDFLGKKSACLLYRMTSDEFFDAHDPEALLGREIDFAFLDGMHLAEFLLRDFTHTERHCRKNSVIALHDCIPVESAIARRVEADFAVSAASAHPHWWTGDVWKVVVALKKFRPDLSIYAFDAFPTGVVVITNLDPASCALADNYDTILASFRALDLTKFGVKQYIDSLRMIPTRNLRTIEDFSQYFWL